MTGVQTCALPIWMSEEDVEALRKEEGIQKVLAYKECSQLYMKADREDPYQKAMEDDMLSSQTVSFNEEMERIYGLDGSYQEDVYKRQRPRSVLP